MDKSCPLGIEFGTDNQMDEVCLNCRLFPCTVYDDVEEDNCNGACAINFD